MLAFHGDGIKKVFVWKHFKTDLDYVEFVDSEATIIEKFKETIAQYKQKVCMPLKYPTTISKNHKAVLRCSNPHKCVSPK